MFLPAGPDGGGGSVPGGESGEEVGGEAGVPEGAAVSQVSAGKSYSCGLRSGGSVVCWGDNENGQLTVPSGSFTQISAGWEHSCGVAFGWVGGVLG